jgi:type IV pilus assembly protein PilW
LGSAQGCGLGCRPVVTNRRCRNGSRRHGCGTNFAVDLNTNLQGDNDGYTLGCAAYVGSPGGGAVASADTLTVRRASAVLSSVPLTNKKVLRICTSRTDGSLVNDASGCGAAPTGQINDLVVHTYYVDQDSVQQVGLPSLRRWYLDSDPASVNAPQFLTDEVVPGVEDMQIQFGIDRAGTGIATQYVDAVSPATLGTAQIVAVRIWLLVRAETPEPGFKDGRTYIYGNRLTANGTTSSLNSAGAAGKAYAPQDSYHRLLVSRTIMIRNALGT